MLRLGQLGVGLGQPDQDGGQDRASTTSARGFLRADARAVFAEGITSASYILYGLFKTNRTIGSIFQSSPHWSTRYDFQFQSPRNPRYRDWMDPKSPGRYYRSVAGTFGMTAATFRGS